MITGTPGGRQLALRFCLPSRTAASAIAWASGVSCGFACGGLRGACQSMFQTPSSRSGRAAIAA